MIVTIVNIIGAFIVPMVVLTLPAYWLCLFFKKKSLLERFFDKEGSIERFNLVFCHHFGCSVIAFFYIISLFMNENVYGDKFTLCAWMGMIITGIVFIMFLIVKVGSFLERVHNKIKPT